MTQQRQAATATDAVAGSDAAGAADIGLDAAAMGPPWTAAADAYADSRRLQQLLAPHERDAAILLDLMLQAPGVRGAPFPAPSLQTCSFATPEGLIKFDRSSGSCGRMLPPATAHAEGPAADAHSHAASGACPPSAPLRMPMQNHQPWMCLHARLRPCRPGPARSPCMGPPLAATPRPVQPPRAHPPHPPCPARTRRPLSHSSTCSC